MFILSFIVATRGGGALLVTHIVVYANVMTLHAPVECYVGFYHDHV